MPDPLDDPVTRVIDALVRHVSQTPAQVAQRRATFDPRWDLKLRSQQLDPSVLAAMKQYQGGSAAMPPAMLPGPVEPWPPR